MCISVHTVYCLNKRDTHSVKFSNNNCISVFKFKNGNGFFTSERLILTHKTLTEETTKSMRIFYVRYDCSKGIQSIQLIFFSLIISDNVVSVHYLENLSLISQLAKTKGANLFTTDIQVWLFYVLVHFALSFTFSAFDC